MMLEALGHVRLVQMQPVSIKRGKGAAETYHPQGLVPVERLLLDGQGIQGVTAAGEELLDNHHPNHPDSRFRGKNSISLGFTTHYEAMRDHFGPHMTLGCAAENIIIETEGLVTMERLRSHVLIHNHATDGWVVLTGGFVAEPCLPFAKYAIHHSPTPPETKAALQFLHHGMRGFYWTFAAASTTNLVQAGDAVYVTDSTPEELVLSIRQESVTEG